MDDGAYFLTQKHFLSTIITIEKYINKYCFKDKKCICMKSQEKYNERYNEKIQLMEERWATDMNL